MCIVTVLNHGLRNGGGVGDILRKPSKDVSGDSTWDLFLLLNPAAVTAGPPFLAAVTHPALSPPPLVPQLCHRAGVAGAEPSVPNSPSHPLQESLFPARVVYDLLFFFIVIIIVLNLIFGVIIDTFADLRSEKQKKEEILKTTCFICGEHWEHKNCPKALPPLPGWGKEKNFSWILVFLCHCKT